MQKKKPIVRYRIEYADNKSFGRHVHETTIREVSVQALKRLVSDEHKEVLGATMQAQTPKGGWYAPIEVNQELWLSSVA